MMPKIGITSRFHLDSGSFRIPQSYPNAIISAGGIPLILPFSTALNTGVILDGLDGLLFTGGEDIHPDQCQGSELQKNYTYYPKRDCFEIDLAKKAIQRSMPTLGICRGCQVLFVATGGELISDVHKFSTSKILHRNSLTETSEHAVSICKHSKTGKAYDCPSQTVVSFHHQGLNLDQNQERFWSVSASSEDGLVEAIEHKQCRWTVGVLWHPELSSSGGLDPLIEQFVDESGNNVHCSTS